MHKSSRHSRRNENTLTLLGSVSLTLLERSGTNLCARLMRSMRQIGPPVYRFKPPQNGFVDFN